jgi:Holliday junction resolvasome RuvABC endonuclease subunit
MARNFPKILALNPGTRYLGFCFFLGSDLRDWGVKVIAGRWSREKLERIRDLISRLIEDYQVNFLAIKRFHSSRSSKALKELIRMIKRLAKRKNLKFFQFPIEELKRVFLQEKGNKKDLAEAIVEHYPFLFAELEKEKRAKNPYRLRMFEAIALGSLCFQQLDSS